MSAMPAVRLTLLLGFAATLGVLQLGESDWSALPSPQSASGNDWQTPANLSRPSVPAIGPRAEGAVPSPSPFMGRDALSGRFGLCHSGGGRDCVVDGDTFWFGGEKIRIADIDTPETHGPRCAEEAALGAEATQRMHALLNEGPFTLESADRDTDRYGRKLRIVTRGGDSLGGVLVDEGLARWYAGGRQGWC